MAIYNTKTGERKLEGCVISERGTFRMDTSMDEIKYWNREKGHPDVMYLSQGDWHVERGSDLSSEIQDFLWKYEADLRIKAEARALEREARTLKIGSTVRVVRGRKVPKGTQGKVVNHHYFSVWGNYEVALVDSNGNEFRTDSTNLVLIIDDKEVLIYGIANE